METIYIIGASVEQSAMIETLKAKNSNITFVLVNDVNSLKETDQLKQIENPFTSSSLKEITCYENIYEPIREFPSKEEMREKRKQFENRSRYLSRQRFNIKRK